MRKISTLLIMLLCMAAFTACSKETGDPSNTAEATVTVAPTTAPSEAATIEDASGASDESEKPAEKIGMKVAALKGPTAIGMVKLMDDAAAGVTENNYQFTIAGTADEISTGLVKGDVDIAAIPCNLASVLYNKTQGGIKLAGINTLGVLYIVETGNSIKSVQDLKGKTIYATGLGTVPQYTLNYILQANGIDPEKDLTIEYKTEPTEVAAMLSKSEDAIAMLPQPYVTTVMLGNDKVHIVLDMAEEWNRVATDGSTVVTGVVVVRSEFLEDNREAFDAFMKEYAASTEFVNEKVDAAATLVEKFDIFKAAPMKKAIPYCNITLIQGSEMKDKVNGYLSALFGQKPDSVGGALPAEDFYIQ
ncbi:MAG TPA: ABC transporter substrate-binding protein [Clostridiales bacterium]|nr:ABC transporter substrate-binding protein [Clostridiales bacterium]